MSETVPQSPTDLVGLSLSRNGAFGLQPRPTVLLVAGLSDTLGCKVPVRCRGSGPTTLSQTTPPDDGRRVHSCTEVLMATGRTEGPGVAGALALSQAPPVLGRRFDEGSGKNFLVPACLDKAAGAQWQMFTVSGR